MTPGPRSTDGPQAERSVVIIGAGHAGVMAADRLRSSLSDKEAEQIRIVIINPTGSLVEGIRLHQVAAGTTPPPPFR